MSHPIPDERLLTRAEVQEHFGLSQRYLVHLASIGAGPRFVRLRSAGAVRYRAADVRAWINSRMVSPESAGARAVRM